MYGSIFMISFQFLFKTQPRLKTRKIVVVFVPYGTHCKGWGLGVSTGGGICARSGERRFIGSKLFQCVEPQKPLKLHIPRCTREWNHVPYIFHASCVNYCAFEAEAEAGVRSGSISPQIAIPVVVLFI